MERLNEFLIKEDLAEKTIETIKESGLPVVLWGFGGRIPAIWDYLVDAGINVSYICDNNNKKIGISWKGVQVVSYSQIKEIYNDCNIIIVPPIERIIREIRKQIEDDGKFNKVYDFELYYPFGKAIKEIIQKDYDKISKVYNLLEDEISRKSYLKILKYSITKDKKYFKFDEGIEYFDDSILKIGNNEIFVDCGVLDGATTLKLKKIKGFEKAYCFEADPQNYEISKSNLHHEDRVELINAAVWDKECEITFADAFGGGSAINENGLIKVKTVVLDNFFLSKEVTFIKMDVEGAEINALLGARKIIEKQLPKLAVCVYHKMSDYWEIPLLIHEINSNYKIYIRNYKDEEGYSSAVCYATI